MTDMHYDLLSILYYCYIRNDYRYIEQIKESFNDNNVTRVVANLYFMDEEAMARELNNTKLDVLEMFKISTQLFEKYFPDIEGIFSIEGCDYILDEEELVELRNWGLKSILLVWNNQNKYGSGAKSEGGLTTRGKSFIRKAVELGIGIDLSHMNKETFWDTIRLLRELKKEGKRVKVLVSHSNCSDLYAHIRNIDDEQIAAIKEFDGVMGLVSYPYFLTDQELENTEYKKLYLDHIKHTVKILGINNVGVSTDDMNYDKYFFAKEIRNSVFSYKNIKEELVKLLRQVFNEEEIAKILNKNIDKIFI